MRVLLVEDDESYAMLLGRWLNAHLHEVEWVSTLGEALDRAARQEFDAVLLDLELPDSSGEQSVRQMRRATGRRYYPPILVITAGDEHAEIPPSDCGAADWLYKPQITAAALAKALVREVPEAKELERDAPRPGGAELARRRLDEELLQLRRMVGDRNGPISEESSAADTSGPRSGAQAAAPAVGADEPERLGDPAPAHRYDGGQSGRDGGDAPPGGAEPGAAGGEQAHS